MNERFFPSTRDERIDSSFEDEIKDFLFALGKDVNNYHDGSKEEKQEIYSWYLNKSQMFERALRHGFDADHALKILIEMSNLSNYDAEKPGDEDIAKFAREIIFTYENEIEQSFKNGKVAPLNVLKSYSELVRKGNQQMVETGVEALSSHLPEIRKILLAEKNDLGPEFVEDIFLSDNLSTQEKAKKIIVEMLQEKPEGKYVAELIAAMFSEHSYFQQEGENQIQTFLERHNLKFEDIYPAWSLSTTTTSGKVFLSKEEKVMPFNEVVEANLRRIQEVDRVNSGACKWLRDEWGVKDFGRYPADMLKMQYERRDDVSRPYGVIIMPRSDWNGAFYYNRFLFRDLLEEVQGDFNLRVAECEGKVELIWYLRKFNEKYNAKDGKGQKISLMVLGGHGTENTITFGRSYKKSDVLKIDDLERAVSNEPREYLEENPTFILASCSTGADKGIGQKLSAKFEAKVFAPEKPDSVGHIWAGRTKGGRWRFHAKYSKGTKKIFKQGEKQEK